MNEMSGICLHCGEPIRNKRSDSKFCTSKCRQQHYLRKHEDKWIMNLARTHANILLIEDKDRKQGILDFVDEELEKITDPQKHVLFNKLFKEYTLLFRAEHRIRQFFELKDAGTLSKSDVDKILKEVQEENRLFEQQHSNRVAFLSSFYQKVIFHLRKIHSKMKLEKLDDLDYDLADDFKDELIGFHATITEKLNIEGL